MQQSHGFSFWIIAGLIFLLPIFFIPGGALSLGVAKSALLIFASALATLVFVVESWQEGKIIMPKHPIILMIAALPAVYFLSALLATPASLSLFGYNFEAGTFGFMLLIAALLVLASLLTSLTSRALRVLAAFFISFAILAVLVVINVLFGPSTLLGASKMGNPLGNFTDLSVAFGLLSAFSALVIGTLPTRGLARFILYTVFLLSTALLVVVGFSTGFALALVASVSIILYFSIIDKVDRESKGGKGRMWMPIILGVVSLVFLINPNVSADKTLSNLVSGYFGIQNTDVRPSFSATLGISKAVLSQTALLGSGPNTFGSDWLIYRPRGLNETPFWGVTFPFGAGFLPTQIATTGILGSALWFVFFIVLIVLGARALGRTPESRAERFSLTATLLISIYLWAASFFYAPSAAMIVLASVFTGIFIALLRETGIISTYVLDIRRSSQVYLGSAVILTLVVLGAAAIGWTGYQKTFAAYHFNRAVRLSNVEGTPFSDIETSLVKAINLSPADVYFVALSRLNFVRAQIVANSTTGTPEENRAVFDESIRRPIEAARLAVDANPAGFENWVAFGTIYAALTPEPLAVEGAYENALFAYNEAARRNPANPELPLLLSRLELNKGNADAARSYIRKAIALQQDYADAYLMLAQLEVSAGNTAAAIASAENLAILVPDNPGIHFELGLLKFSSKDYKGASESLGRALALSPDYANARYYLGLSLANLGHFAEAQAQLESLEVSNPENADLKAALEAVKKNKVPAAR